MRLRRSIPDPFDQAPPGGGGRPARGARLDGPRRLVEVLLPLITLR